MICRPKTTTQVNDIIKLRQNVIYELHLFLECTELN